MRCCALGPSRVSPAHSHWVTLASVTSVSEVQSCAATSVRPIRRSASTWSRISAINDPVYLTETLVKSEEFVLNLQGVPHRSWLFKCKPVVEVDRPEGAVPHYLPGANPSIDELTRFYGIPREATLGGAETALPEYMKKIEELRKAEKPAAGRSTQQ